MYSQYYMYSRYYTYRWCTTKSIQTYCDKVCVFGISDGDYGVNFFYQLLFLIILKVHVPLGEAGLTSTILNQDETNLHKQQIRIWEGWKSPLKQRATVCIKGVHNLAAFTNPVVQELTIFLRWQTCWSSLSSKLLKSHL